MMRDGRILSSAGRLLGTSREGGLALTHSETSFSDDGAVTQTPSPGLPPQRLVGYEKCLGCAASMSIVALAESASGASMAVVDGVAERPVPVPPPQGSRCTHVPR